MSDGVYSRLYQRLRPALFALSTHGTKIDVAGMALLEAEWRARTVAIKDEIYKITGGAVLWSVKEEISEQAACANQQRSEALKSWNARTKGVAERKTPEVQALREALEAARQNLRCLRESGQYYRQTVGVGLSDRAIKQFLGTRCAVKLPTKRNKESAKVSETVDDVALKKIARERADLRPLTALILEHRKCLKMSSTYCDVEKVDGDGRIRCQWKPCGTQTGRLASAQNPLRGGLNQQNIPDHDDYGFRVKRLFLSDEGCLFLKLDLSMAEARNFFWRTGDPALQEIAASRPAEVDVYKWIAGLMLGKDPADVTKEERQICGKKIGLSSNYGVGPKRMSDSLLKEGYYFSEESCSNLQQKLFQALPGIRKHQSKIIGESIARRKMTGTILLVNSFGRQIEFIHERLDIPLYHRLFAWPSQSDIGDHNNQLGLVPFWHQRRAVGWHSQHNAVVHDENLISVRPDEAWAIATFMANSLERPYDVGGMGKLSIPVQIGLGLNWQDMEEFKGLPSRDEFMAKVEMLCRLGGIRRNF